MLQKVSAVPCQATTLKNVVAPPIVLHHPFKNPANVAVVQTQRITRIVILQVCIVTLPVKLPSVVNTPIVFKLMVQHPTKDPAIVAKVAMTLHNYVPTLRGCAVPYRTTVLMGPFHPVHRYLCRPVTPTATSKDVRWNLKIGLWK
jgi:hypothetical protein